MLGVTLARFGCYGVLVWLIIGFLISVFYVGEYLDRPPEGQPFWKAGVTVRYIQVVWRNMYEVFFRQSGALEQF